MYWQAVIFFLCLAVLYVLVAGGIGMYINAEKGRSKSFGFALGAFLPIVGLIIVGFNRPSSKYLIEEAEKRELISLQTATSIINLAAKKDSHDFVNETKLNEIVEKTQSISLKSRKNK